jgi:ABC-type transporter Mla subunit MlaD
VKYRGVPIGEISAISFADRLYPKQDDGSAQFDYGSPVVLRMKVRLDVFGPGQSQLFTKDIERGVANGLRARMRSTGLTGGLFVELDMVEGQQYAALMPAYVPDYPYVPIAPSRFDEVLSTLERITASLAKVDFEKIGASAESTLASLNRVVDTRLDTMLANADSFIADLKQSNELLQKLLGDPKLRAMIADGSALAGDLRTSLPAAVQSYGELGAQLNATLAGGEYDVQRLLRALRETAENLEALSERIGQDPPKVLFSPPPRKLAPGEIER